MDGFRELGDLGASLVSALQNEPGLSIVTWFIALTLLWSGGAKLRNPGLAALAIADFGLSRRPRSWHGVALGATELLLGLTLVLGSLLPVMATACIVLFAAFTAVIARSLRQGARFSCYCFGSESAELSWRTLLRPIALIFLVSIVATAPLGEPYRDFAITDTYFTLVSASASLAAIVLLSRLSALLRWNTDVLRHFRRRQTAEASS